MDCRVTETTVDIAEYCRQVEEHLARVNAGQIVRVVGPAFELVRGWALEGMPLTIVFHGIDRKAERHRAGRSKRPLRLEFCEDDVRETFDRWRRAVGLPADALGHGDATGTEPAPRKRPSLSKHLERVADRLSRVIGRLDWPDDFRDRLAVSLDEVSSLRETVRTARGDARSAIPVRLARVDEAMMAAAKSALPADVHARLRAGASTDLAAYEGRVAPDVWRQSVDRATDQLIREHFSLPTVTFDEP